MTALEVKIYLETKLGIKHVYFQPPEGFKLDFPCIVYNYQSLDVTHANNGNYINNTSYRVTLMDEDPYSKFVNILDELPYCRFVRPLQVDGMNHWIYTLYTQKTRRKFNNEIDLG